MGSEMTFAKSISEYYWMINIEDIYINNIKTNYCEKIRKESQTDICGIAFDSGTFLYNFPSNIIYDLQRKLNIKSFNTFKAF